MANEYQITTVGTEVLNTGDPNTVAQVTTVGTEVLNTGDPNVAARVSTIGVEILRSLTDSPASVARRRQLILS